MSQAVNFSASLKAILDFTNTKASDLATPNEPLNLKAATGAITYGAGLGQSHYGWSDEFTLAASATMAIDLYDLAIDGGAAQDDGLGRAVTTAKIKGVLVAMANATPAAGDRLQIDGGNASTGWTSFFKNNGSATTLAAGGTIPGIELGPDGFVAFGNPSAAGYAVADTTNHILRFTNPGSTTVVFDVAFFGTNS